MFFTLIIWGPVTKIEWLQVVKSVFEISVYSSWDNISKCKINLLVFCLFQLLLSIYLLFEYEYGPMQHIPEFCGSVPFLQHKTNKQDGTSDISSPILKFLQYHYVVSLYYNSLTGQLFKLYYCLGHSRHNIIQRWFISYSQVFKIMSQVCFQIHKSQKTESED